MTLQEFLFEWRAKSTDDGRKAFLRNLTTEQRDECRIELAKRIQKYSDIYKRLGQVDRASRILPTISIGRAVISLNEAMVEALGSCRRVVLMYQLRSDGPPDLVMQPDPDGYRITLDAHGNGGLIQSKAAIDAAHKHLGAGTRRAMERDGSGWTGRPQQQTRSG